MVIPCTSPILELKQSEKLPSCFTLDFYLEYIDLIRSKSFPVTPHLASFIHKGEEKERVMRTK